MKVREPRLVRVLATVQEREHLTLLRVLNRLMRRKGHSETVRDVENAFAVLGVRITVAFK